MRTPLDLSFLNAVCGECQPLAQRAADYITALERVRVMARGLLSRDDFWSHVGVAVPGEFDDLLDAVNAADLLFDFHGYASPPDDMRRRHKAPEGQCKLCDELRAKGDDFHPSHDASLRCESGSHSHCSCDTCF